MDSIETVAAPQNLLFYRAPVPLNRERHAKLALVNNVMPYSFAADSTAIPLTVGEFVSAALFYPVVFAGEDQAPVAVVGLNGENLIFKPDGALKAGAYVPAYVRRYPFVIATTDTEDRLVVCIDEASPLLSDVGQTPLFESDGAPTDYTLMSLKFCDDYETERRSTASFLQLIKRHELLEARTVSFTPEDATGGRAASQTVAEFYAVSEAKLNALSLNALEELRTTGALALVHAHLTSLSNWPRLITLARLRSEHHSASL